MGEGNLESLSKDPGLAKLMAARKNLLEVYGPARRGRYLFDEGLRIQGEIRDTGTCPEVEDILGPLGQLVTYLPGTLTRDERMNLMVYASQLEDLVGEFHLSAVVLTWVMREPVRRGEVSLELIRQRPAQPKSFAQILRNLADTLEDTTPQPPPPGGNITPFRRRDD